MATRKPEPVNTSKESAQILLNTFLKEHKMLIGTQRPKIEFTDSGAMMIYPPQIFVVYEIEIKK